MPTKAPTKKMTSWSFSRYSLYRLCPAKFKFQNIDKIMEPKNAAMQRGADIHDMAEAYIKGTTAKMPPELKLFEAEFKELKTLAKKKTISIVVEESWAMKQDWSQTEWNNWAECWVRIKMDAAHFTAIDKMLVRDWKTGKMRPELHEEYLEQLELYGLAALVRYPHVKEVRPQLAYLDAGVVYPTDPDELVYTQADVPRLKKLWEKRVKPMMNDTTFAPRANDKCKWCFYGQSGKSKGGPGLCKF